MAKFRKKPVVVEATKLCSNCHRIRTFNRLQATYEEVK